MSSYLTNLSDAELLELVTRAQGRSQVEMDAFVHRTFVFDAGLSFYCKVCGWREQSLQPAETFDHRPGCPLAEIQARVMAAGGWPSQEPEGS